MNPLDQVPVSNNNKPKIKGKVVATIFGLVFLLVAIGAGIILVNQRQFTSQKAADPAPFCTSTTGSGRGGYSCIDNTSGSTLPTVACGDIKTNQADCENLKQTGRTCTVVADGCRWISNTATTCTVPRFKENCTGSQIPGSSPCLSIGFTLYCCPSGENIISGSCQKSSSSSTESCISGAQNETNCAGSGTGVKCINNLWSTTCVTLTSNTGGSNNTTDNSGSSNSTTPSTCSDDCFGPTYNGVTVNNCGSVGRTNGTGNCNNGQLCCAAPGSGSGGGSGTSSTPAPTTRTCGEACSTDTECQRGNSASVCRNKVCVNVNCPTQTQAGKNCACLNTVACGQQPLFGQKCGTGSEHGFINVPGNTCAKYEVTSGSNGPKGYEYCIPSSPTHGYKYAASCTDLQVRRLAKSDGSVTGLTQQDVLTACSPEATATPTPTGGPTAACSNIAAYDSSWNPLTPIQLTQLKSGSIVYFTVRGTTTNSFDKAQFTINGNIQSMTTNTKPNSNQEYYFQYTIPAGTTSFTVTAQLHDQGTNQWY